jgi:hypothetical protein
MNNPSPLKQLAAFAICFTAGAVSVMALALYKKIVKGPAPASQM